MRAKMLLATVVLAAASLSFAIPRVLGQAAKLDTAAIEQATGLKGQLIADENVFKVTKPRTDVKIQVDQWAADHCHTLAGGQPILALDMYEHSYHMDYGANAGGYVDAFMQAIRWDNVVRLFDQYSRQA